MRRMTGTGMKRSRTSPRGFAENWFLRCQDLVDTYKPDLLYLRRLGATPGAVWAGHCAHYYNSSVRAKGKVDVVLTAKDIKPEACGRIYAGHRAGQDKRDSGAAVAD